MTRNEPASTSPMSGSSLELSAWSTVASFGQTTNSSGYFAPQMGHLRDGDTANASVSSHTCVIATLDMTYDFSSGTLPRCRHPTKVSLVTTVTKPVQRIDLSRDRLAHIWRFARRLSHAVRRARRSALSMRHRYTCYGAHHDCGHTRHRRRHRRQVP